MSHIEYGIRHVGDIRVYNMRNLHDATTAWKEQDNPNEWVIVERHISNWSEVE